MRKIFFFLLLTFSISSFAQESRPAYCEITAYSFLSFGKVRAQIDLGASRYGTIVDENGKQMKFNSTVDILNYMSRLGWKVTQTYFISTPGTKQQVLRYLLEKQITDDSQISEGIYVKQPEKYEPGKNGDDMY